LASSFAKLFSAVFKQTVSVL